MIPCLVCGDPSLHALGRCMTCYRYLRRRGFDRSFELVRRLTEKDIERALVPWSQRVR